MEGPVMHPITIISLPPELVELTLIFAAAGGFPTAIGALAQTCRYFRTLVYQSPDQHLWREAFLTTFDDPRVCEEADADWWGEGPAPKRPGAESGETHDWGKDFRMRVWSGNFIKRRTSVDGGPPAPVAPAEFESSSEILVLHSLRSVIETALPCPPTLVFSFLPQASSSSPVFPLFPPLPNNFIVSHCRSPSVDQSSSATSQALSHNISWLEKMLLGGLPPELANKLAGLKLPEMGLSGEAREHEVAVMRALSRVVCCTGYLPVSQREHTDCQFASANSVPIGGVPVSESITVNQSSPEDSVPSQSGSTPAPSGATTSTTRPSGHDGLLYETETDSDEDQMDSHYMDRNAPLDMSTASQYRRARRLARMRVYNMQYLTRAQHWGPFLPASGPGRSGDEADDEALLRSIFTLFADHTGLHDAHGDDEDDDEDNEGDEDERTEAERRRRRRVDRMPIPDSSGLRADWTYLAAARIVLEANLREAAIPKELNGLLWLDGLRRGSAAHDAGKEYCMCAHELPARKVDETSKGKGKGRDTPEMHKMADGWDWAGVTGVWRRCVCWLDYRDLILQNLSHDFNHSLQEAVRIIRMRLRVVSYSPSLVPEYPHRPTIHVEGETANAGHGTNVRRKLRGTVSVIADGSVRWSLVSTTADDETEEWVTEGVQIGGTTSAMGVIGMWTGARHERTDPLGPFWAWKVA